MRNREPMKRPRKVLLRLGSGCNNLCEFCHDRTEPGGGREMDAAAAERKILAVAEMGADMVVFSGGEPTIRRDFMGLCEFAVKAGLDVGVITNGRMLVYRDFADRLPDLGVKYLLVSLHGSDAATHNRLTGADSFRQTVAGLRNVAGKGMGLVVNTVLTRANAGQLTEIENLLSAFGPLRHKISLPEPKGAMAGNSSLALRPREASEALARHIGRGGADGVTVGVDGLTPCLLKDYFIYNDDFFTHGYYLVSEPWEEGFFAPDHGDRSHRPECLDCSLRHLCPGLYSKYFEWFPRIRFRPLWQPISNAVRMDFVRVEEAKPCLKGSFTEGEPERWAAEKRGGQLRLHYTEENATTPEELLRIKFELEQVYAAGDDADEGERAFGRKLELTEPCRACAGLRLCPGVFETAREQPREALIRESEALVELLKGNVLEVGFGGGPYFEKIRAAIRDGRIERYVGIDPEANAAGLDDMDGKFVVVKSTLEDFRWDGAPFDSAAMFRSYHHLRELDRAMASLAAVTAAGSLVIVTEDFKHMELHEGREEASGGGEGFHHYRNHSAELAVAALRRHGFAAEDVRPVRRDGASWWSVVARKQAVAETQGILTG